MAERRPVVLINGELALLPGGDTLPGAGDFLSSVDEIISAESFSIPLRRQMIVQDEFLVSGTGEIIISGTLVVKGA